MFFRYVGTVQKPIDLYDLHQGACWIVGSAPSLQYVLPDLIQSKIPKIVINNAALMCPPTYWISGDRPVCFAPSILKNPNFIKFARLGFAGFLLCKEESIIWRECPNTFFYGGTRAHLDHVFRRDVNFVWTHNTFIAAIQLAWRLGFTEYRFVGCDMIMAKDTPYVYTAELKDREIKHSQNTYDTAVKQLEYLMTRNEAQNLKFISCNPASVLANAMPVRFVDELLKEEPQYSTVPPLIHNKRDKFNDEEQ